MDEKTIKKAYQSAEEELGTKQINKMKGLIKNLFEQIEEEKNVVNEHKRLLRLHSADLTDLKAGKLSKVLERQQKDEFAKKYSTINVDKVLSEVPQRDSNTAYYTNTQLVVARAPTGRAIYATAHSSPACKDYRYQWWMNNIASGTYVTINGRAYYI